MWTLGLVIGGIISALATAGGIYQATQPAPATAAVTAQGGGTGGGSPAP